MRWAFIFGMNVPGRVGVGGVLSGEPVGAVMGAVVVRVREVGGW